MCELHYSRWARGDMNIDRPHRDEARPKACAIDACDRAVVGRGLCSMHRQRWMRGERGAKLARPSKLEPKPPCKIAGCGRPFSAKGFCNAHYVRWKYGARGAELAKPIAPQPGRVRWAPGRPRVVPHLAALVHGRGGSAGPR